MRPLVWLHRKKDGSSSRMIAKCSYQQKDTLRACSFGTANWRAKEKNWSMPLEPVILRRIKDRWPDVRIDLDLLQYFKSRAQKQKQIYASADLSDPVLEVPNLKPFQCASVRFLETIGRGILGHEMGLGKTVIACGAIKVLRPPKVLILCPNTIKWSWAQHLSDWAGRRAVILQAGSKKESLQDLGDFDVFYGNTIQRDEFIRNAVQNQDRLVLIINYSQVRDHWEALTGTDWDVFTIDEAHRIKNRQAKQTQSTLKVANKSSYVWMLTGTPIRNDYSDLYTMLHICDPERFRSYWNFINVHLDSYPGFFGGVEIIGMRNAADFRKMLAGYMFRKEKKEVLPELPDKIYNDIPLPLNPHQQEVYVEMEQEFVMMVRERIAEGLEIERILFAPNVIAQLIRLRQICLSPAIVGGPADSAKLDALADLFVDFQHSGEPFVIYSSFRKFLPYITALLRHCKIPFGRIVGGQQPEERRQVEKDLNSGEIQAIVGTISAMGEGLNLQKATTAIFTDIDWVPAVNVQAEDRIHRIGIQKSPIVIRLYHPLTIEADIRGANIRKQAIADETVGQVEAVRRLLERGE